MKGQDLVPPDTGLILELLQNQASCPSRNQVVQTPTVRMTVIMEQAPEGEVWILSRSEFFSYLLKDLCMIPIEVVSKKIIS